MIQRRGSVKQIARNLVNHGRVARCKVGWLVFGTVRHDFYPPAEGGINFRRVVAESFRLFARNSPGILPIPRLVPFRNEAIIVFI